MMVSWMWDGKSRGGEKWLDYGYAVMVGLTEFSVVWI